MEGIWIGVLIVVFGAGYLIVLLARWFMLPFQMKDQIASLSKSINSMKRDSSDTANLLEQILKAMKKNRSKKESNEEAA